MASGHEREAAGNRRAGHRSSHEARMQAHPHPLLAQALDDHRRQSLRDPLKGRGGVLRSASSIMLRNFSIEKTRPARPSRAWRYSTGPPSSSRMATATASTDTSHNGSSATPKSQIRVRSNGRL